MAIPIENAIAASIEISGRTGRQACERGMILMAQSARAATKQAKKSRKIERDGKRKYFTRQNATGAAKKSYRWRYDSDESFNRARMTPNRGLAKRSWMWGLKDLRRHPKIGKPIPGVAELDEVLKPRECGFVMTNRLKYITKAAPANVQEIAAMKASNKIMAQSAKALERRFGVVVPRLAASRNKRRRKTLPQAYAAGKAAA